MRVIRNERLLRTYIRHLVREAAITPKGASASGLALYAFKAMKGGFDRFVLYDPSAFHRFMKAYKEHDEHDHESVISLAGLKGYDSIIMGFIETRQKAKCNNAGEVKASVAVKGYGPMMYDIAMAAYEGGIISDRSTTSASAKNVWKGYNARGDVASKPLDNIEEPKTDDPNDDCYLVDDELLDRSYSGAKPDVNNLTSKHNAVMTELEELDIPESIIEDELKSLASSFFDTRT
jgi:hypothetical protein